MKKSRESARNSIEKIKQKLKEQGKLYPKKQQLSESYLKELDENVDLLYVEQIKTMENDQQFQEGKLEP